MVFGHIDLIDTKHKFKKCYRDHVDLDGLYKDGSVNDWVRDMVNAPAGGLRI